MGRTIIQGGTLLDPAEGIYDRRDVALDEGLVAEVTESIAAEDDEEVIDAADRLGIAMVFTGVRHFRH